MTLVTDIARAIDDGLTKAEIRAVIQSYLADNQINMTEAEWIIDNKKMLVRWALPDWLDFFIAWVKFKSGEEPYASEGQAELDAFVSTAMAAYKYIQNL